MSGIGPGVDTLVTLDRTALGSTNADLAPFDWDASPADFHLDYVSHCGVAVSVFRAPEPGYVYDVAIVNHNADTAQRTDGHDLGAIRVSCHGPVDETPGTHRLDYITSAEPADARDIRVAAAILISGVAADHARGFCTWGRYPIAAGLY